VVPPPSILRSLAICVAPVTSKVPPVWTFTELPVPPVTLEAIVKVPPLTWTSAGKSPIALRRTGTPLGTVPVVVGPEITTPDPREPVTVPMLVVPVVLPTTVTRLGPKSVEPAVILPEPVLSLRTERVVDPAVPSELVVTVKDPIWTVPLPVAMVAPEGLCKELSTYKLPLTTVGAFTMVEGAELEPERTVVVPEARTPSEGKVLEAPLEVVQSRFTEAI